MSDDDDLKLVNWRQLKENGWSYSRTHTDRMIKDGRFPKPLKFGTHRHCHIAWRRKDIRKFLDDHAPPSTP